jgi:hypothetical protein
MITHVSVDVCRAIGILESNLRTNEVKDDDKYARELLSVVQGYLSLMLTKTVTYETFKLYLLESLIDIGLPNFPVSQLIDIFHVAIIDSLTHALPCPLENVQEIMYVGTRANDRFELKITWQ